MSGCNAAALRTWAPQSTDHNEWPSACTHLMWGAKPVAWECRWHYAQGVM